MCVWSRQADPEEGEQERCNLAMRLLAVEGPHISNHTPLPPPLYTAQRQGQALDDDAGG